MAKYYYRDSDGNKVYIKTIDTKNTKLTFTTDRSEAYNGRGGYYARPLKDGLVFGFSEAYPQVKNLQIENYD